MCRRRATYLSAGFFPDGLPFNWSLSFISLMLVARVFLVLVLFFLLILPPN